MNIFVTTLQFFLGFGIFVYLIWPLIADENDRFPVLDDLSGERRKKNVLEALRDIEYERETGKINSEDYRQLREHYLSRAVKLFDDDDLETFDLESSSTETDLGGDLEQRIAREREKLN